jgi:dihydrofolate reductase
MARRTTRAILRSTCAAISARRAAGNGNDARRFERRFDEGARVHVSLIWAMARNRVIGRDNALPWQLPDEMRYFMRTTLGKPVIMGRKQWQSMDKPLPKRTNIVITRDRSFVANGATVVHTLDEAFERARDAISLDYANGDAMVIGGAEIFALALPLADRLYCTVIDADIDGDVHFPDFDESQWRETHREEHAVDARHPYAYTIRVLERAG